MAADGVQNFPAGLAAAEQGGFLARSVEEGLESNLAWRRVATREKIPAGIGDTYTHTRKGRLTPITTASTPQAGFTLDDGLTPATYSIEQYTLTLFDYQSAAGDVDLIQAQVGIFDQALAVARNSGVQAAQSKERIARGALFNAYLGGNTRVRTDLGASSTTTCHVDDIRGFQTVLVNGVVTAVSGTNTLTASETGTTAQTLTITLVTADGTNHSVSPGGISGVLTFNTATAPTVSDAIVASNAPSIFRPYGRTTTMNLVGGDMLTIQLLLDMKAQLENNAVPTFDNGCYLCILDPTSMRQLFTDQDFKVYFAGRQDTEEVRRGFISEMFGIELMKTNETLIQAPTTNGADIVNVTVRRPMMIGAEALIEGTFQGLDNYVRNLKLQPTTVMAEMVDDTVQLLRQPIDRLGRWYSWAWDWIGGYAVPTDLTANSAIIPTASNAYFKRAVIAEHAG